MSAPLPPVDDATAIVVNERVTVPRHEIEMRASRAGGPGGQHVNTSSTRIELTWNLERTTSLDEATKARVREKLKSRLDGEGTLRIVSSEMRSQAQNRERAEERFADVLRRALAVPKPRKKTRVPKGAKEERLKEKRMRSERKRDRRDVE